MSISGRGRETRLHLLVDLRRSLDELVHERVAFERQRAVMRARDDAGHEARRVPSSSTMNLPVV
jgi:hypothetical protein